METNILLQYTHSSRYSNFDSFMNSKALQTRAKTGTELPENFLTLRTSIQYRTRTETHNQVMKLEINFQPPQQHDLPALPSHLSSDNTPLALFEDSYWGSDQTADRLANFVISGGGDNLAKIRSGREGIIRGFKEAEQLWGETLPEISYKTLEKALEKIDNRIRSLGEPVIDVAA